MNWIQGDVAGAIVASKSSNSPLIILITGTDAQSRLYLDDLNKSSDLVAKAYVALQIEANSLAHEQLMAIYGNIGIPSVLVISPDKGAAIGKFVGPSFGVDQVLSLLPKKQTEETKQKNVTDSTGIPKREQETTSVKLPLNRPEKESIPSNPSDARLNIEEKKHSNARIQLKLQGRQSEVVNVNAEETMAVVRTRASEIFELSGPFDVAIPYPRRVFRPEEDLLSVETLGLCPTSTLIVLPKTGGMSDLSTARFTNTFFSYLEPILSFFRNLWGRFTGRNSERAAPTPKINIVTIKRD